jgi:hypothetical protein
MTSSIASRYLSLLLYVCHDVILPTFNFYSSSLLVADDHVFDELSGEANPPPPTGQETKSVL